MTTVLLTDKGHYHTIKILVAAFEIHLPNFEIRVLKSGEAVPKEFSCPSKTQLPALVVNETTIFSANAACRYVFQCGTEGTEYDQVSIDELAEWESTVLSPAVYLAVSCGNKDNLDGLKRTVEVIEQKIQKCQHLYLLGAKLSSADIIVFASLFPVMCQDSTLSDALANFPGIKRWCGTLNQRASVQKAISTLFTDQPYSEIKQNLTSHPAPLLATVTPKLPAVSMQTSTEADSPPAVVSVSPEEIASASEAWLNGSVEISQPRPRTHPVLPLAGERNVLITSALPYVNNVPHLGNLIGCVLSADVFSRFCRLRGYNTLYICGTDEYGTATETKAIVEGMTPREICDKYHKLHAEVYKWFNIDFDAFGRTSTPKHTEIVHDIFWDLHKNGYIAKDDVQQLRCENCQRFLADRFVEGICPLCAFDDARGDQCDGCGKLINATELLKPQCKICRETPIVRTSKHLFLDLPKLEPLLTAHLDAALHAGHWTNNAKVITRSWIRDGLKARCISRDLKWGVDVPLEGYTDKVFYVWFDAAIGYCSITANYTDDWEKWWKNTEQVELYQFMAKDNVPFHSVVFPSSLLGTHNTWTVVNHLSATEYLNYEDCKFSKSRGKGVFGNDPQQTDIPADIWRFYLLYLRPESQDSTFSWDDFAMKNNSELLNNLGNFINRALMFINNNFAGEIQQMALVEEDSRLLALVTKELRTYLDSLEKLRLRDGIRSVLAISRLGNQYMQANKPWVLVKGMDADRQRAGTVLGLAANIVSLLATMVQPYMPAVSQTIHTQLAAPPGGDVLNDSVVCRLPAGHKIGKASPLFQKIEASVIDELKKKFAGEQQEKKETATPKKSPVSAVDNTKLCEDIEKQGNIVRQLKAEKAAKDKIAAEVAKLLDLKKKLTLNDVPQESTDKSSSSPELIAKLTNEVKQQGDLVRQLKGEKASKTDIDAGVARLLELKKQLTAAGGGMANGPAGGKKKGGKKK